MEIAFKQTQIVFQRRQIKLAATRIYLSLVLNRRKNQEAVGHRHLSSEELFPAGSQTHAIKKSGKVRSINFLLINESDDYRQQVELQAIRRKGLEKGKGRGDAFGFDQFRVRPAIFFQDGAETHFIPRPHAIELYADIFVFLFFCEELTQRFLILVL